MEAISPPTDRPTLHHDWTFYFAGDLVGFLEEGFLVGRAVLVKVGVAVGTFISQPMKSTEHTPVLPNWSSTHLAKGLQQARVALQAVPVATHWPAA
mmetsp:Transcript_17868/g.24553  ORF Transcript_17868/g.24553 Transcript_17868/m.24553 type:complete len:96 (+) Transcript_17868:529-816(+)